MVGAIVLLPVLAFFGDVLTGQAVQRVVVIVLVTRGASAGRDVAGGIVFVDALVDDQAGFIFQVLMTEPSQLALGSGFLERDAERRGDDLAVGAVFDLTQDGLHLPRDLGPDFGDPTEDIALVFDAST